MTLPFFTVGHSTRSLEAFATLLHAADVALVVDIRTVPRSRANPQFNSEVLAAALAPFGIDCTRMAELGGFRGRSAGVADQVNAFWTHPSFHRYADYALTPPFQAGLARLVTIGRERRTAVMCAEAVWWRCHRRIVADHLLARGETVVHLMDRDRLVPARLTEGAVADAAGNVRYPARRERGDDTAE